MDYEEKKYEVAKEILLKFIDKEYKPNDILPSGTLGTWLDRSIYIATEFINELKMRR